ncbi:MAG: sugar phosphate isomerase/epimerase [Chloroflexi bacterium]|nr:sugar phosphate isomerase/epimerase [Chloroflexota bacterium]
MDRRFPLGVSASPDRVAPLVGFYDFIEPPGSALLMGLADDEAYEPQRRALAASPLPVRAFNVLFPPAVKLVGDQVDWAQVEMYLHRVVNRAADLGARVLVFGSGGARNAPEGFTSEAAFEQLVRVLTIGADIADRRDINFVVEGLRRPESNMINSFAEALALARRVNRASVKVLADIYHMVEEQEPFGVLRQGADLLAHVHLSGDERRYPGYGEYPLRALFDVLGDVDYQGAVSIECRWGDDLASEALYAAGYLDGLLAE